MIEREASEIGEEANHRANSRQSEEYFDHKSYSYRLIGHIYACKEEYPSAVSALRSAVELSPTYCPAIYDFAQYSAQLRDKETCVSMLKEAIDADIFYFYLAEKESNFAPLSREVGNLLDEISTDASDRAKAEITKAQGMISDAENSIAEAEEAMRKCPNRSELLSSSYRALEDAKSRVGMAESKVASKDYRASLDAIPIAEQAHILANRAKKEAVERIAYYKNERSKRLKKAILFPLWAIPLSIVFSAVPGGFLVKVLSPGKVDGGIILGAVAGLLIGIVGTIAGFLDVNDVK